MTRSFESGSESSSVSEQPAVSFSPDWQDQRNATFNAITDRSLTTANDTVNQYFPKLSIGRSDSDSRQQFADSLAMAAPPESQTDADGKGIDVARQLKQVKTPAELGAMWDEALAKGNFKEVIEELGKAVRAAHLEGGLEGVKQLEKLVNEKIAAPRAGSLFVINGDKADIINGRQLPKEDAAKYATMAPAEREKQGIRRVDGYGWIKDLVPPQTIDLPKRAEQAPFQPSDLTADSLKQVNELADKFGKDLKPEEKASLTTALKAVMSGDVDTLKKMAPYADQAMSEKTEAAFKQTLRSVGFRVHTDGYAERSPDGQRQGEITIVPPGSNEGLRVRYDRARGWDSPQTYRVEAVTVKQQGELLKVTDTSANRQQIDKQIQAVSNHLRKSR